LFFVTGMVLMTINAFMTIRKSRREQTELEAKLAAKLAQA
jgi:cbb3-type cytochrome oxidase subunit 1